MTNTQHTPGPWRIGDAGTAVFEPKNGAVPRYIASDLTRANARLIASAPDLLEACKLAHEQLSLWVQNEDQQSHEDSAALNALVSAIAKATQTVC